MSATNKARDRRDKMVVIVYTPRAGSRRIILMRYANERERRYYAQFFA